MRLEAFEKLFLLLLLSCCFIAIAKCAKSLDLFWPVTGSEVGKLSGSLSAKHVSCGHFVPYRVHSIV